MFKIVKDAFARHIEEELAKTKTTFFVFNEGTRFELNGSELIKTLSEYSIEN